MEPVGHTPGRPGAELLAGAVDCHVHACPHLNARSVDVLQAVEEAGAAGMRAIGLIDNFANSSGLAALANRRLGHLGVEVFGGLVMEPPAGGVCPEAVRIALGYGYGPGDGARFVSLPTHHTRHVARSEGRSPTYVEGCLEIPEAGRLPDPLPEILDLVSTADAVFNTGHVSGPEAVRAVEAARAAGVSRILAPCSHFEPETVAEIAGLGAVAEFSFFFASHATQVGLTHVDAREERHRRRARAVHGRAHPRRRGGELDSLQRLRRVPPASPRGRAAGVPAADVRDRLLRGGAATHVVRDTGTIVQGRARRA